MHHQAKGTCILSALAALALLGCSEAPDAAESIGEAQQALLGNTSWSLIGSDLPFPQQALSPVVTSKRLNDNNFLTWAIAQDTSGSDPSQFILRRSTKAGDAAWSNWNALSGATNVFSPPAVTSWRGFDMNSTRNVVIAYIEGSSNKRVRLGISPADQPSNVSFIDVPGATGNHFHRPALAYLNNRFFVFTVNPSGVIRYKYISASDAGLSNPTQASSWSTWQTVSGQTFNGGIAAAATASDFITIMGVVGSNCFENCVGRMIKIRASTGFPEGSWSDVPGSFREGTSMSMAANALGTGARVAALRGGLMQTATSPAFSTWETLSSTNCFGAGEPGYSPMKNTNRLIFVDGCGSVWPQFSTAF